MNRRNPSLPASGADANERVQLWLAPSLIRKLDEHAGLLGLSRSRYIAEVLRVAVESASPGEDPRQVPLFSDGHGSRRAR